MHTYVPIAAPIRTNNRPGQVPLPNQYAPPDLPGSTVSTPASLTRIIALLDLDHSGCEDVMSGNSPNPEAERKEKAVITVQRAWRAYSVKKQHLDANIRWTDAYFTARKRVSLDHHLENR